MSSERSLGFVGQSRGMTMTKGYQTTEFYICIFSVCVSGLLASGIISNALALQVVGAIGAFTASLGYTGARAFTKVANEKGKAITAAAKLEEALRGE